MKSKTTLIIFVLMSVAASPFCIAQTTVAPTHAVILQTHTKVVTLSIPSMTCPVCPITIKKALKAVKGVNKVEVNFKTKTATVTFNSHETKISDLIAATEKAGYPSSVNAKP